MARLYIPTTDFTVEAGKKLNIPAGVQEARDNKDRVLVWSEVNGCIDQKGNFTAPKVEKDTIFTITVLRLEDPNDKVTITITVKRALDIRLEKGKVRQEGDQFVFGIEALTALGNTVTVSFYEGLTKVGGAIPTNNEGKAIYTHSVPLSKAGETVVIRAQVDNTSIEKSIPVELPPKPDYDITKGGYEGLGEAVGTNWAKVKENPKAFLRTHFFRPTITLVLAFLFLYFAGGGALNVVFGILLGAFAAWRIGKRLTLLAATIAAGVGMTIVCLSWFFPSSMAGPIKFGIIFTYLFGGLSYLVEIMSRDKNGKPILNWFPTVPIIVFVAMMVLNFFGAIGSFVPEKKVAPTVKAGKIYLGKKAPDRINLSKSDNLVNRVVKKPFSKVERAFENASKNTRDIFDWLACILVLVAYVAGTEAADTYNKRKKEGKPRDKESSLWEPAGKMFTITEGVDMTTRAYKALFKKSGKEKPKEKEEKPKPATAEKGGKK